MIKRLKDKWQVSIGRLVLILMTFAIGGSLTGYLGRLILAETGISVWWLYYPLYVIIMTMIWPLMVLIVSTPLGQFNFFTRYLKKMASRLRLQKSSSGRLKHVGTGHPVKKIAIFASGAGSNAQKIIDHFRTSSTIKVAAILYNKSDSGVKKIAEKEKIPAAFLDRKKFFESDTYIKEIKKMEIDLLVLAGFLWKIPDNMIAAFPNAIINIHPALLPNYGGKGMYGNRVHKAVLENGDAVSGITIHYVDGHYDNGDIIFQAECPVMEDDTPETLAARIHALEHANYPLIVESLLTDRVL